MIPEFLKDKLQIVANDEVLIKAMKALFEEVAEKEKPEITPETTNELLGEKYRAYTLSKVILLKGFIELSSYKNSKSHIEKFNKER